MVDLESMSEEKLQILQRTKNKKVNELRAAGKYAEATKLREEVLEIAKVRSRKQEERFASYMKIAEEANDASSAEIQAEAAAAIVEAEKLMGG